MKLNVLPHLKSKTKIELPPKVEIRITHDLCIDIGGGTADVCTHEINHVLDGTKKDRFPYGVFSLTVTGISGDINLGGQDWTNKLTEYVINDIEEKNNIEIPPFQYDYIEIQKKCEEVKKALSYSSSAELDYRFYDKKTGKDIEVSYRIGDHLFNKITKDLTRRLQRPILDCLKQSKLSIKDIDNIILIGGSSRLKCIRKILLKLGGKTAENKISTKIDADEAVAIGAAYYAHQLKYNAGFTKIVNITPFDLSIKNNRNDVEVMIKAGNLFCLRLRPKKLYYHNTGTLLPKKVTKDFGSTKDGQTALGVCICEGLDREVYTNNREVVSFKVPCDPAPAGVKKLTVTFDLTDDGLLDISAVEKGDITHKKVEKYETGYSSYSAEKKIKIRADIDKMIEQNKIKELQKECYENIQNLLSNRHLNQKDVCVQNIQIWVLKNKNYGDVKQFIKHIGYLTEQIKIIQKQKLTTLYRVAYTLEDKEKNIVENVKEWLDETDWDSNNILEIQDKIDNLKEMMDIEDEINEKATYDAFDIVVKLYHSDNINNENSENSDNKNNKKMVICKCCNMSFEGIDSIYYHLQYNEKCSFYHVQKFEDECILSQTDNEKEINKNKNINKNNLNDINDTINDQENDILNMNIGNNDGNKFGINNNSKKTTKEYNSNENKNNEDSTNNLNKKENTNKITKNETNKTKKNIKKNNMNIDDGDDNKKSKKRQRSNSMDQEALKTQPNLKQMKN